jgi:hypothetical protein
MGLMGLNPLRASASSPTVLPPCALLTLEIKPAGTTTLLDGQWLDENVWLISLIPGWHHVEIRKPGFQSFEQDLAADPGQRLRLAVSLEKEP